MCTDYFDTKAYLKRIQYEGGMRPTLETLKALHHAHLYSIPFENFDILLDRGINLSLEAIFDKLVHRKRGGYCYELNGLFLDALKVFGFEVRALLARTHVSGQPSGRGHQLELVIIDGKQWIADVGFGGDTPRMVLPMTLDTPLSKKGQTIRLTDVGNFGIMVQSLEKDKWNDLYSFDLTHVFPGDIEYGNHYNSTHPNSFFTVARVVALPLPNGGVSLLNRTLKKTINGKETILELEEGELFLVALKEHFGIDLGVEYKALRPIPGNND